MRWLLRACAGDGSWTKTPSTVRAVGWKTGRSWRPCRDRRRAARGSVIRWGRGTEQFESPILRHVMSRDMGLMCRETLVSYWAIGRRV